MSATTTSPACVAPGDTSSGSFGAPSVTVRVASIVSPIRPVVSADKPDGRSTDTIGTPDALRSSTTVRQRPSSGRASPVPKSASTTTSLAAISASCAAHESGSATSTTGTPTASSADKLTRASPSTSDAGTSR